MPVSIRRCAAALGLVVAALSGAAAQTAPADTLAAAPPARAAVPEDTTITWPDVDWSLLDGADPDSLIRSGLGVILAFEDTFSFDPGSPDTMLVDAPRVTIGEVIEAIGRRMDAEAAAMRDVEFTSTTTIVERDVPGRMGDDYKVTEIAERRRFFDEGGEQSVRLWKRERKVADGEVVEEEVDEKQQTDWDDVQSGIMMAMPFSTGSGHRFRYAITGRELVGNSLIYRIDFEPKNRFEALPSGTVWVDYSHWVIRKLEARMTGAVPLPWVLKSVPVFRISRERFGEYWFTTSMSAEIELHRLPLVNNPRVVEMRTSLRDVVINGQPRGPDSLVPRRLRRGNLDPDDFWLGEEAAEDSLRAYWGRIAEVWDDDLTPALRPVALSDAQVDSLTREGSRALAAMATASPWTFDLRTMRAPGFNRVQGAVARMGVTLRHRGPARPRLDLDAGYAFGNGRPELGARLLVPLVRGTLPVRPGGALRRHGRLEFEASGWKGAAMFGGDGRRGARVFSSLFWGSDPNSYFASRGVQAGLSWRPHDNWQLWGGYALAEEHALEQTTTWNVLGRSLRPDGNPAAVALDDRRLRGGMSWRVGPLKLDGSLVRHAFDDGAVGAGAGGRAELLETMASMRWELLDGRGNTWLLRGRYRGFDGPAPRQWRVYEGDYGTLRGFRAGELVGDRGASGSLDLRLGADVFEALRVPGLRSLGLQPLVFVDIGRTYLEDGSPLEESRIGERWDFGLGLGKRLDLPFALQSPNLRVYVARAAGPGTGDEGWRVLVGFEP